MSLFAYLKARNKRTPEKSDGTEESTPYTKSETHMCNDYELELQDIEKNNLQ